MKILEKILVIKDYIFPIFCLSCDEEGVWLCSRCKERILRRSDACPVCAARNLTGQPCAKCRSNLDQIKSIIFYQEQGLSGRMIKLFKYGYAEDIYTVLEKLVIDYLSIVRNYYDPIDYIVPVPLHPRRQAARGFNQAEKIAQTAAEILDKKLTLDLLRRIRYTRNQAQLNKIQRTQNIKDAFEIDDKFSLRGLNILLVDDVFTTGATMQECAKVLKKNGASRVWGLVLGRG